MKNQFTLFFCFFACFATAQSKIEGRVVDQQGEPIPGANIYLEGTYDGTSSDLQGQFHFTTNEEGNHLVVVTFVGFEKYEIGVQLPGDQQVVVELVEQINQLEAVVVSAGSFSAGEENSREVLKPLDIVTTAGATADIAGALNTLPGTQTVGETGRLFVRGGEGYETKTFIDGMEVLNSYSPSAPNTPGRNRFSPFMFGGTSFSTGGYSAEYGQALSSALILKTKDIPTENRTDLSLMTVGTDIAHSQVFEHSSIAGKIQYTHLEPYFRLVNQDINYDKAPHSIDGNIAYRHKVDADGMVKFYGNFNRSDLTIYQPQIIDPSVEDRVDISNRYLHLNANYKDILDEKWSMKAGVSLTNSQDDLTVNLAANNELTRGFHSKTVISYDPSTKISLSFGAEHFYRSSSLQMEDQEASHYEYDQHLGASFVETDLFFSNDFMLRSGLRLEYDDLTGQARLFPRTSLAHKLGKDGQLSFAYGRFNQHAQPVHLRVNDALRPEAADHFILNYQVIKDRRTFRIEGYHKRYTDLVKFQDPFDPLTFDNTGEGYARGIDLFWRDNQSIDGLDYWISYSYIDTKRDYLDFPGKYEPSFSSAHNFSVVTKYFVNALKTQVGATYSFASNRPYHDPNALEFNSGRTPAYHDLSLNFSYLYKPHVILHASITNVLGVDNIFGYEYSDELNSDGRYVGRAIRQPAARFIFFGAFITLSKNKTVNQLPNL